MPDHIAGRTRRMLVLVAAVVLVLWQSLAFGQSGLTTYGDLLSPQELATIQRRVIASPPTPPPGFVRPVAQAGAIAKSLTSKTLPVPTSTWTYGCTPTSAGMIFAYYDRNGYPNMYTGPANGGVCPLTDVGQGDVIASPVAGACSIIATQNGFDGRVTPGHADDYYSAYNAAGPDPWVGLRTEHAWGGCTADYMGSNQWRWNYDSTSGIDSNTDGATTVFSNNSSAKLYNYVPPAYYGTPQTEACHGLRLFAESRGYTVLENYTQEIDALYAGGFSFANYVAEIDAGFPVMLQLDGHTMVGVGYDTATSTVYCNDTWDNAVHTMTWGGSYSGMAHQGVTIIHLAPDTTPPTGTIVINSNRSATNSRNVSLALTWNDGTSGSGVVRMRFSDDGSTWTAWQSLAATLPYTLPPGADGHRTVRVQFLDKANNRSATYSDFILLDTTAPTGSITINGGASTTTSTAVTLGLTWADGSGSQVSRVRFSDDGAHWTAWCLPKASMAHTLPGAVGYKTVRAQFLDGAGNYSLVYNDYIKLVTP